MKRCPWGEGRTGGDECPDSAGDLWRDVLLSVMPTLRPGSLFVLDPFAGSRTTLVAAQELDLSATGFESSTHWCERASQRIAARPG
ncbi:MAG: DNA methyltransferase [Thermomicrobiales bacterium]